MITIYKVLSVLLSYPTRELQLAVPDLLKALESDPGVSKSSQKSIERLARNIADRDIYDAQERYVLLFDRTRSLSLHLFEHVHGESRDRGQAMVDLNEMYAASGIDINTSELPDYLPLFLEYLSISSASDASELLEQVAHIVVTLRTRLAKRKSVYSEAFRGLEDYVGRKPDPEIVMHLLSQEEDDPNDLEELDNIWKDDPVTFGGNAGDNACGLDRIRVQARAAQRRPAESPGTTSAAEV